MAKEYTLKDFNKTVDIREKTSDNKNIKYKIEFKNDKGKEKISVDNGEGTHKIKAKVTKVVEGQKDEDLGEKDVEISYDKDGWFTHYAKIDKVDDKELEKKETIGFSGIGSFRPTFWISIVAALMLLAGLI